MAGCTIYIGNLPGDTRPSDVSLARSRPTLTPVMTTRVHLTFVDVRSLLASCLLCIYCCYICRIVRTTRALCA